MCSKNSRKNSNRDVFMKEILKHLSLNLGWDVIHVLLSIVYFGRFISLEVVGEDMEDLVNEHCEEPTAEKHQDPYLEVQWKADVEISSDEEKDAGANVRLRTSFLWRVRYRCL